MLLKIWPRICHVEKQLIWHQSSAIQKADGWVCQMPKQGKNKQRGGSKKKHSEHNVKAKILSSLTPVRTETAQDKTHVHAVPNTAFSLSSHRSSYVENVKKKKVKQKRKPKNVTADITSSLGKLDINSQKTNSAKRQPLTISSRSHSSYSAGSSRSFSQKIETLEDVARYILSGRAKSVVVMCGAGISTASGIPDFRTPGTGLYDNLQRYKIPNPTAVFDLDYFRTKPKPFFELAKELYPSGKYRPNIAHYFLRCLNEKGLLQRIYTQNIDGLERLAGIPPSKLVEAHGTFATASCTKCGKSYDGEVIKEKIFKDVIPRCESTPLCFGVIKPDIVFFGEDLPKRFYYYLRDFPICDLLIVMGTSLQVEPFASLVDSVRFTVPRLLLNREKVGPFRKSIKRPTDVVATGDLVETVTRFSTVLGWKKFLNDVMEKHENTAEIYVAGDSKNSSDSQCDSGISSASSESSERQKPESRKSLPPLPHGGDLKRYFHTLRSTPLTKVKKKVNTEDNDVKESSPVPQSLSYYEFIRKSSQPKSPSYPDNHTRHQPLSRPFASNALQLLDMQTLAKSQAPVIQYAHTVEKQKKCLERTFSSISAPPLSGGESSSPDSASSDSDCTDSDTSSDS